MRLSTFLRTPPSLLSDVISLVENVDNSEPPLRELQFNSKAEKRMAGLVTKTGSAVLTGIDQT